MDDPRHAVRRQRRGPLTVWLGAVGGAALLGIGGCAGTPPEIAAQPQPSPAPAEETEGEPGDLGRGRELFAQSCAWCHGQQGEGSQYGPSLVGVGAASADFYLSTGRMPLDEPNAEPERSPPALGDRDIDALVDYVASLGEGPEIPEVEPGNATNGLTLYLGSCAACHSSSTTGGDLPGGEHAPSLVPADPTQIAEAIRLGPGAMPQFPEESLSDAQMNDVVSYVVSLREPLDHGGHPLGSYGPAAEGLVGWVVGLGLLLIVARLLGKRAS